MASSSTSTPLLYACIAHNTTILTEHTTSASSASSSLPSLILPKISHTSPQKLTYTHGDHYIHYIASAPSEHPSSQSSAGGLTFLTVADASLGRRIPFGFLVTLQKKFLEEYDPATTDFAALPSYGAASFNARMKALMVEQGGTEAGQKDALRTAQREIEGVREIMTENIERVLERGERIDLLVDKTDRLGSNARDFRVRSRGLRRRMWWKNVKLMVLLALVVIFLVYLFVGFGCGLPGWSRCLRH
ncbi:vesicle-associated membrane protein-like protein [Aaosphaeria arxii CBS 175.79]|uniref:Synaptobrevin homolog YKT6 n=1 Tax=Aaosphaeria arxii CBS 175.79 TaxID=1450172 RepID=A0A6A5Y394_9PLEO|nr:vesicle-associated membrane protein-like protein [Aaosphaeria arxii CBS 175.79]KAF2020002.1 vesicle-associated membrane protein-like protein [Aaosphaeria arxii CBS 175.79]